MNERSYLRVANALNSYGVWTSWCSQFLTEAGFRTIGMLQLERSLRKAGWQGNHLTLHVDVDPGSGFGLGDALIDDEMLGERAEKWIKVVRDHVVENHMSYVLEGKQSHCASATAVTSEP